MKAITGLLASLLLGAAAAQEVPIDQQLPFEDAAEVRRYKVEVIIFTYAEDVAAGSEIFPPDAPVMPEGELFPDGTEVIIGDAAAEPVAEEIRPEAASDAPAAAPLPSIDAALVIDDEFSMQDVLDKLELLDAYEPIMHLGWTQAPLPREQSQPLEIAYFGKPPAGLEGNLMLYLGRYLHLVVDIALAAPDQAMADPAAFDAPIAVYGDERLQFEGPLAPQRGRVRYRITDDRIFKNGDIRYFDHPKFGVIAKIVRVEEPDADEQQESAVDPEQLLSGFAD
ncbi:MAG: peptidoglycan binding protein CsiV [Gammaproteobacteria bacterium]|nr:peptidoglycan binding protein CsiV [Gammaproteobacteria bacterium]